MSQDSDQHQLIEQERLIAEQRGIIASTKTEIYSLAKALETMKAERDAWRETAQQLREELKTMQSAAAEYEQLYLIELLENGRLKEGKT